MKSPKKIRMLRPLIRAFILLVITLIVLSRPAVSSAFTLSLFLAAAAFVLIWFIEPYNNMPSGNHVSLCVADTIVISLLLIQGGEITTPLLIAYVLTAMDHGLYSGTALMGLNIALNSIGLTIAALMNQSWHQQPMMLVAGFLTVLAPMPLWYFMRKAEIERKVFSLSTQDHKNLLETPVSGGYTSKSTEFGRALFDKILNSATSRFKSPDDPIHTCGEENSNHIADEPRFTQTPSSRRPVEGNLVTEGSTRLKLRSIQKQKHSLRVLLVLNDSYVGQQILERILTSSGYEINVVTNTNDVIQQMITGGFIATIIDLDTPGIDGLSIIQRFRLQIPKSRTPIIVITADTDFETKQAAAEAGADAFLTKPIAAEQLITTLSHLSRSKVALGPHATSENFSLLDPVIDLLVISEIEQLYTEVTALETLVRSFEHEMQTLMLKMEEAVANRTAHEYFAAARQIRAIAATVGAHRLVVTCEKILDLDIVTFRRLGAGYLADIRGHYNAACLYLHEFVQGFSTTRPK